MADGLTDQGAGRDFLRDLREEDITEHFAAWFEQPDSLLDFYSASRRSFTRDTLLAEWKEAQRDRNVFFYAIVHRASGEVIGNIKLGPINPHHKTSDLATLIGNRAYLGKGLAKEAIALADAIAFERHDIRKLYSGMYAANIASIKAYTAAGWVIEGLLKGQYLVDGKPMDRVLVACFNPKYFPDAAKTRP
jgi:ribosomal-protein-alanine N-acetyltransferase